MGLHGENTMGFTEELLFELHQSNWSQMTTYQAGCLFRLEDIETSNKDQKEFCGKIHAAWDAAINKNETFIPLC